MVGLEEQRGGGAEAGDEERCAQAVEEGGGEEAGRHCCGSRWGCGIEGERQLVVVEMLMVDVHLSSG